MLFYLGSNGKHTVWQNPHSIGQIQAFASSVGSGTLESFVGRAISNTRTQNEPYSFFGFDLGEGRTFLPSSYTMRNRNSQIHVMMNWHLEGSNDKCNWVILDRRVYMTGDPQQDAQFSDE